jgi:hypothetical protein
MFFVIVNGKEWIFHHLALTILHNINGIEHVHNMDCYNPSLGLTTKARGYKVVGQEEDPEVTSLAPGSAKGVREWTLTLPSELPLWELESQMDSRLQGSKPMSLKGFLYH